MLVASQANAIMVDIYLRSGALLRGCFTQNALEPIESLQRVLDTLRSVDFHLIGPVPERGHQVLALSGHARELRVRLGDVTSILYRRLISAEANYPAYDTVILANPAVTSAAPNNAGPA